MKLARPKESLRSAGKASLSRILDEYCRNDQCRTRVAPSEGLRGEVLPDVQAAVIRPSGEVATVIRKETAPDVALIHHFGVEHLQRDRKGGRAMWHVNPWSSTG